MKDYNAFVGKWPFYELPREGVEQLRELHAKNGVYGGYVSSVESIFYNDFYESEQKLSAKLRGAEYGHVISPNPALAECGVTLERALSDFDVKGIRLHPEYHGYRLTDPAVSVVTDAARERSLPIFITARMHDDRLCHMIKPYAIDMDDLKRFLRDNADLTVILCQFKIQELELLKTELEELPKLYTDTSSLRSNLFGDAPLWVFNKAVFGSGYPLLHVSATALMLSELPREVREAFFSRADVI
jgi:predicted TIM-barrel fold metal-dependent hydrolase